MDFFKVSFIILIVSSFISCGGDDASTSPENTAVPVLTTATVSAITQLTAQSGGNITSDGGATVSARGVCWSTNESPTVAGNKTTDGSGSGSFTSTITGLTSGTIYYVRAFATNSAGTGYGNNIVFTATVSSNTVTDIDGNVYQTVTIGTHVWMAENLKVTRYRNGDAIPIVTNKDSWGSLSNGAYCEYNNDVNNVVTYGRLYNWYAVDDSRKLAPAGWHVPTDGEWKQLEIYLGMSQIDAHSYGWRGETIFNVGGKLKETGTTHWISPNEGATNETGFTALAGGVRVSCCRADNYFMQVGTSAGFWTSTESDTDPTGHRIAIPRWLSYHIGEIKRDTTTMKKFGMSVRLVKD